MFASLHHVNNPSKPFKVCSFGGPQNVLPEERDHLRYQVGTISNHQHVGPVTRVSVIWFQITTSQSLAYQP